MRHQWFSRNFTKLREYFLCVKKTKITTLFVSSASPYSTILESITYVNNVYCSVLVAPYADALFTLFTLWSERKQRICVQMLHMLFTYVILSKMALWGDAEEANCWIKLLFLFSLTLARFLHKILFRLQKRFSFWQYHLKEGKVV